MIAIPFFHAVHIVSSARGREFPNGGISDWQVHGSANEGCGRRHLCRRLRSIYDFLRPVVSHYLLQHCHSINTCLAVGSLSSRTPLVIATTGPDFFVSHSLTTLTSLSRLFKYLPSASCVNSIEAVFTLGCRCMRSAS